jgi:hypothetical protein
MTGQGVNLKFLGAGEGGEVDLQASSASGNIHTQLAEAWGAVRLSDGSGRVGFTEHSYFEGVEHRASGEDPVQIDGPGYRIQAASGYSMDLQTPGSLTLFGPVTTFAAERP